MWRLLPAVDCDPDSVPRAEESLQVAVSLTPLSPGSSSASALSLLVSLQLEGLEIS